MLQQFVVFFQRGTAPGRVRDNGVKASVHHRVNVAPRQFTRFIANAGMNLQRPQVEAEEPLRAEVKSFLEAVRNRSTPVVSLEDGRRALSVALDIVRAMAEHHRRANLEEVALRKS